MAVIDPAVSPVPGAPIQPRRSALWRWRPWMAVSLVAVVLLLMGAGTT